MLRIGKDKISLNCIDKPLGASYILAMANVMILAGLDPTAGAGLGADLKTVTVLGEIGLVVPTALTIQNSLGVEDWVAVDVQIFKRQLENLLKDISIDAVKIGMVPNKEIAEVIASFLREHQPQHVVFDPVIYSKNNFSLSPEWSKVTNKLFPLATLITPNQHEAELLLNRTLKTPSDMCQAAKELQAYGPKAVLITGGDWEEATDVLYDGKQVYHFSMTKRQRSPVHGSGCVYSSAIATFLAKGLKLKEAISQAKRMVTLAIDGAKRMGQGYPLSNPYAYAQQQMARYQVITELRLALKEFQAFEGAAQFLPEVRSNLVYALPYARRFEEVAGFEGRLTVVDGRVTACGPVAFGASRHMASVVLTAMEQMPSMRAAMNIRYKPEFVTRAMKRGYQVKQVFRSSEAPQIKATEGRSLPWLTAQALKEGVPDFIYDEGDYGKEPMIRVLASNPLEVIRKVISIAEMA